MRKQYVWLIVFVILALGISFTVYFASRAEKRMIRVLNNQRNPLGTPANRMGNSNNPMNAPVMPPRPVSPDENLQHTMQTLKDIQRINRMNAENQRRQQQTPTPPKRAPNK